MIKKYFELNKSEKMDLLKLIASGEISKADLNKNTRYATKKEDFFACMLSQATANEEGEEANIVLLSEALEAGKQAEEFAKKHPPDEVITYL